MTDEVQVNVPLRLLRGLIEKATECAQDLESELDSNYPSREEQPVQERRFRRDMDIVHQVEDLVSKLKGFVE